MGKSVKKIIVVEIFNNVRDRRIRYFRIMLKNFVVNFESEEFSKQRKKFIIVVFFGMDKWNFILVVIKVMKSGMEIKFIVVYMYKYQKKVILK